jgi:hypothetical protein
MKFLIVSKMKDTFVTLPTPAKLQILQTTLASVQNLMAAGKILAFYYSPSGYNVSIIEYKTVEAWTADQHSLPIIWYSDHEVYPLTDGIPVTETIIENLKTAETMAHGLPRQP